MPPTTSCDSLSGVAEYRLHQGHLRDLSAQQGYKIDMAGHFPARSPMADEVNRNPYHERQKDLSTLPSRTSSPTDAILIKRTALPDSRGYAEPSDAVIMESFEREQK